MPMKPLLLLTLFWISFLSTSLAENGKRFHSILVGQFAQLPGRNSILIDFDSTFAWMGRNYGDTRDQGGSTEPGVFVYSKKHNVWIKILEVSTDGAKFGKQEDISIPAPWDFTNLASQKTMPLPILTAGAIHLPDKVVYDEKRDAFVLHFDSRSKIESQTTTLLIPKKDLMEAFDHLTPAPQASPITRQIDQKEYAAGQSYANRDLNKGIVRYEIIGEPSPIDQEMQKAAKDQYGIAVVFHGCVPGPRIDYDQGYLDTVKAHLIKKHSFDPVLKIESALLKNSTEGTAAK